MVDQVADESRRKALATAAKGLGGIGIVAASVPFIRSMAPSEAAKAAGAPVRVDVNKVAPGSLFTIEWRGRPIWVLHRTDSMIQSLGKGVDQLVDPLSDQPQQPPYAKNPTRSIKPDYLVLTGVCTHLGCIPLFRPDAAAADLGADWPGGFYCPCHGSKFDLAGRVFKNVPAPLNLEVPRHQYVTDAVVLIGEDRSGSA